MADSQPWVIILAGPNGAGKTTTAPALLRDVFSIDDYVNADVIAQGLCGFAPETAAIEAGRIMLGRIDALAARRVDLALETTLASRSLAPWLERLSSEGYRSHLVFLALPSAEAAIRRVALRVRLGGHDVPEPAIRRRFKAGLRNFFPALSPYSLVMEFVRQLLARPAPAHRRKDRRRRAGRDR
jgi:predicted ABC-type ATPase